MLSFKPTFTLSSLTFIKRFFSSSLSAIRVVSSAYLPPYTIIFCPFNKHFLEQLFCCCCCLVTQSCLTLCDPWAVTHQAPLSIGFFRQEYWSELPFPSPEDLPPDPGIKATSPASAGRFFTTEPPGKSTAPLVYIFNTYISAFLEKLCMKSSF